MIALKFCEWNVPEGAFVMCERFAIKTASAAFRRDPLPVLTPFALDIAS